MDALYRCKYVLGWTGRLKLMSRLMSCFRFSRVSRNGGQNAKPPELRPWIPNLGKDSAFLRFPLTFTSPAPPVTVDQTWSRAQAMV